MKIDNYKKLCEEWRLKALHFNYEERYAALGLPGYNENNLPIMYYGVLYEINRPDARIYEKGNPEKKPDIATQLAIYHLFYYSQEKPHNANIFVPLHDVKHAAPFSEAFKKMTLIPFAKTFEGKINKLMEAGEKLGFKKLPHSDAGFQAMAFACMPIQFLFWDGDDEFTGEANILFDENITDFTHEETVVSIAADGVKRLVEAADLTLCAMRQWTGREEK